MSYDQWSDTQNKVGAGTPILTPEQLAGLNGLELWVYHVNHPSDSVATHSAIELVNNTPGTMGNNWVSAGNAMDNLSNISASDYVNIPTPISTSADNGVTGNGTQTFFLFDVFKGLWNVGKGIWDFFTEDPLKDFNTGGSGIGSSTLLLLLLFSSMGNGNGNSMMPLLLIMMMNGGNLFTSSTPGIDGAKGLFDKILGDKNWAAGNNGGVNEFTPDLMPNITPTWR